MNKKIKTTLLITIGLLALITVVGFIYGLQNQKQTNDIYASYNEEILSSVESSVKICQGAFKSVGATEEETESLNYYVTNINDAESPVLKAYIANCMLIYTGDFVMVKENNYEMGQSSKSANFAGIQEKLVSAKTRLSAARNYADSNNDTNNTTTTKEDK